jgi:hypothetical protein
MNAGVQVMEWPIEYFKGEICRTDMQDLHRVLVDQCRRISKVEFTNVLKAMRKR